MAFTLELSILIPSLETIMPRNSTSWTLKCISLVSQKDYILQDVLGLSLQSPFMFLDIVRLGIDHEIIDVDHHDVIHVREDFIHHCLECGW